MDDPIAVVERFRDAFSAGTSDRRLDLETGARAFETIGIEPGEMRMGADGESVVEFHIDRASALRAGGLDPAAPGPPDTEAPG